MRQSSTPSLPSSASSQIGGSPTSNQFSSCTSRNISSNRQQAITFYTLCSDSSDNPLIPSRLLFYVRALKSGDGSSNSLKGHTRCRRAPERNLRTTSILPSSTTSPPSYLRWAPSCVPALPRRSSELRHSLCNTSLASSLPSLNSSTRKR